MPAVDSAGGHAANSMCRWCCARVTSKMGGLACTAVAAEVGADADGRSGGTGAGRVATCALTCTPHQGHNFVIWQMNPDMAQAGAAVLLCL